MRVKRIRLNWYVETDKDTGGFYPTKKEAMEWVRYYCKKEGLKLKDVEFIKED
jgi:hypothetical protein